MMRRIAKEKSFHNSKENIWIIESRSREPKSVGLNKKYVSR